VGSPALPPRTEALASALPFARFGAYDHAMPRTRAPRGAAAHPGPLWPAAYVLGFFVAVGFAAWRLEGHVGSLVFLVLIGVAIGAGFAVHARARPSRKALGPKLSVAIVGLGLFLGAGVFGRQSFQLEGFFFHLLAGVWGGVVTHYVIAKLAGPLLVGRAWCGWGCWIWMVLEYLPWRRSPGRREGLGKLRVAHLAASAALVATLAGAFDYDPGFEWSRTDALRWFLGGAALYYVAGVALATALRDNRAFCKYLCPNAVLLRAGARLSLLKVAGSREGCDRCGACERICPMDVKISSYALAGRRVLDPECTLCQACIAACPNANLRLTIGVDAA
jgi:ferredoxin-type protein NapH